MPSSTCESCDNRWSATVYPGARSLATLDILNLFSEFRGEWDPNRRALKRFRLEDAGQFFRIPLPNSHRAADDARLARALLRRIGGLDY